jgi:hypothetical protein
MIYATRDRSRLGGWAVPVGSIINDELRACDHCGQDVNVLTIRTANGPVVVEDDYHDRADEDSTTCAKCVIAMGPDE